jgi:hypothetical protein
MNFVVSDRGDNRPVERNSRELFRERDREGCRWDHNVWRFSKRCMLSGGYGRRSSISFKRNADQTQGDQTKRLPGDPDHPSGSPHRIKIRGDSGRLLDDCACKAKTAAMGE